MTKSWPQKQRYLLMHELSLCQSLLDQVEVIARRERATRVTRIWLRVGPLAGVEAALLIQAFSIARAGTLAADAELLVDALTVRVRCTRCDAESDVTHNRLLCAVCGDFHTSLISGDELLLTSVELVRAE